MNDFKNEDQWLDEKLANPAVIADRGFSNRIQKQISLKRSWRNRVFASAGGIWVLLAMIFLTPQTVTRLYDQLLTQLLQTDEFILSATETAFTGQYSLQEYLLPFAVVMLICYGLYTSFQSIN